jgi:hypothetical protein
MYSAFDKSAMQYAESFCEEAERLQKSERDSCLAMAGAVLLSISLMGRGKDHDDLKNAKRAFDIGQRLGFFSNAQGSTVLPTENISKELRRANSYAAWGTFNWNV